MNVKEWLINWFEKNSDLTKEEIDYIDLLEPFSNQGRPPEYFSDDLWHPNEEGHEFIAKQLVKFVMAEI